MLDVCFGYLQQTMDAFYQRPPIEVNLQDALVDHPFSDLHRAILLALLFFRQK